MKFTLSLLVIASLVLAEEGAGGVVGQLDIFSEYYFRGMSYSEGLVVQPQVIGFYGPASVIGFVNYDTDSGDYNEADIALEVEPNVHPDLGLTLGYGYFHFANIPNDTQEVYAKATYAAPLRPSLRVYWDVKDIHAVYTEAAVSETWIWLLPYIHTLPVTAELSVGHGDYWGFGGLSHAKLGVMSSFSVGDRVLINPQVNYSYGINRAIDDIFYGGVSFVVAF